MQTDDIEEFADKYFFIYLVLFKSKWIDCILKMMI
jgi:hypothetical protein